MSRVVAFVPAKGSSERLPNKNTRSFNGEPFFVFTLRKLLRCSFIDDVYIDSESPEILAVGARIGAKPLLRDPQLATNQTDGNRLFANEIDQVHADIYIQHLCTSPFIKEATIERSIGILQEDSLCDSVLLGRRDKYYHWRNGWPAYDIEHIPNSIDLPNEDSEAMGLYAVRNSAAHRLKRRIGDKPRMIFGDPLELIDVNDDKDFELAQIVAAGVLAEESHKLRLLCSIFTSAVLSDVLDEFGIRGVLPSLYVSNFPGARMFGRARTLHLRTSTEEDPPDAIYEALGHYSQVVSNDLLVVSNERSDLAYFGELNMNLAIRAGAVGALVDGVTRDSRATASAQFPVFSTGRYCQDVKGRGAVKSINQPVTLRGVTINPSDLVFADEDGVVVIPRKFEARVLERTVDVLAQERRIVADVCREIDVKSLVDKYGFF